MASLPLQKLGSLLIKTVSKPIARRVATQAANHKVLGRACMELGQIANWISVKVNVSYVGQKVKEVRRLDDAKAMERGANVISESLIFGVSAAIIIFEYDRSAQKSAADSRAKQDRQRQKELALNARFVNLEETVLAIEERQSSLRKRVDDYIDNLEQKLETLPKPRRWSIF